MNYEDTEILVAVIMLNKKAGLVSTTELAKIIGLSQQSASRKLILLEKKGLIRREIRALGQKIIVLDKGFELIRGTYSAIKKAIDISSDDRNFKGKVVTGSGEGSYYIALEGYKKQIEEMLGFVPFFGTLNIKIDDEDEFIKKEEFVLNEPIVIEGFDSADRKFGEILAFKCKINGTVDGALIIPKRTHHDKKIAEIIAPVGLRNELELADGDVVEISF